MDPIAIYAIATTLVNGFPKVSFEQLPKGWTMADCIKHHEEKLNKRPNTQAFCLSRERPYKPLTNPRVYLISVKDHKTPGVPSIDLTRWKGTIEECQQVVDRFAGRVQAFCYATEKLETRGPHRFG